MSLAQPVAGAVVVATVTAGSAVATVAAGVAVVAVVATVTSAHPFPVHAAAAAHAAWPDQNRPPPSAQRQHGVSLFDFDMNCALIRNGSASAQRRHGVSTRPPAPRHATWPNQNRAMLSERPPTRFDSCCRHCFPARPQHVERVVNDGPQHAERAVNDANEIKRKQPFRIPLLR